MMWRLSHKKDRRILSLVDRHYSRQKPGTAQFVPPGQDLTLRTEDQLAVWVTSVQRYQDHRWAGAWVNALFRNEGPHLSSELITAAAAATRWKFGEPPAAGLITFIDEKKVRWKKHPGYCYRMAGFVEAGRSEQRGHLVLQLTPDRFPAAAAPVGWQLTLPEVS